MLKEIIQQEGLQMSGFYRIVWEDPTTSPPPDRFGCLWRLLFVLLFACILPIGVVAVLYTQDCARRDSIIPGHPVYPNAKLIRQSAGEIWEGREYYYYETQDSPSQIVDFYDGKAACTFFPSANHTSCRGEATPFGNYVAAIPNERRSVTSYYVEMYWDKCSGELFGD